MNSSRPLGREILLVAISGWLALCAASPGAQPRASRQAAGEIRIVELQGKVEISPAKTARWFLAQTNQVLKPFDQVRTGPNSRAALRWADSWVERLDASTAIEILPPPPGEEPGLHLIRGLTSFFHRGKAGRLRVVTRGTRAGIEGTEFVMAETGEEGTERTTIWVIDGAVGFSRTNDPQGALTLVNGEAAFIEGGQPPVRIAGFNATNLLQWCFYYPAVLDLRELPLTPEEEEILAASLAHYRAGNLVGALVPYSGGRQPASAAERLYYAALLLSVGQVEPATNLLVAVRSADAADRLQPLALALRQLIAAVKREPNPATGTPQLATELLAASYYEQSRAMGEDSLRAALHLAWQAATNSPEFGFAWARVAELEFSFGHTRRALEALNKSLALSPRNAQALALQGFLLAAQNKIGDALDSFDQAIAADPALANGWLGRGLCRIRRGDRAGGREDLLVAAALEPQRAALRSYLGKAWSDAGDDTRAKKEFGLAQKHDPQDPTPWLYSALNHQQQNRINDAIRDLEKSQELNQNRSVYRSQLLLDQDRAVRSANLARIYEDAGMTDVAFREAVRAVNSDYANYSAHLFLANSYNALRDPRLVNLRFETAESTEYFLANLMAPVGAGVLTPSISQQEYSRLFERDRLGVISLTEYLSRGAWLERGAQFGTFGNTSYSVEGFYRSDRGERPNSDLEQMQLALLVKQQFTPQDTAYVQVSYLNTEAGDVAQRYDPQANLTFRSKEYQDGLVNVGYHHEWSPGNHTLVLAGYLPDRLLLTDQTFPTFAVDSLAAIAYPIRMAESYRGKATIYFAEAQQILQHNAQHLSVAGGRFQWGDLEVQSQQMNPTDFEVFFPPPGTPASVDDFTLDVQRWSLYAYHHWELVDDLWLVGGIAYDHLEFPENFLFAPLSSRTRTRDKFLPKAGLVWSPFKDTTLRFAYTRSLTGTTLEQSYRLEPAQVAGFTQAYRGVIPETAIGGPTPGAPFDVYGVSLEQKFSPTTYFGLAGELLDSAGTRTIGGYYLDTLNFLNGVPASLRQNFDYTEKSLVASVNQLVGRDWSFGARYRIAESDFKQQLTDVVDPFLALTDAGANLNGVLHQLSLDAVHNHPSGFFGRLNALWTRQSNRGYVPDQPGDDFWQFNLWAGFRFARRKAEVSIGLLNLTDQDYRLNPLTPYNELPHHRTLAARLLISF